MNDSELASMVYEHMGRIDQPMREHVLGLVRSVADAATSECDALRHDAERYRWLRERDWTQRGLCVVAKSASVKLGHDCPSHERLDAAIDTARNGGVPTEAAQELRAEERRDEQHR